MKKLVYLGPASRFDAGARFGKAGDPEYVFYSPDARIGNRGARHPEAGVARAVTNDEAEDLLTFPHRERAELDHRFAEADAVADMPVEAEVAPSAPRSPEDVTAEVAREIAAQQEQPIADETPSETKRARRTGSRED